MDGAGSIQISRRSSKMILTIIPRSDQNLKLAGFAATAICGAGLTQPFPGGLPFRPNVADRGSLEVQCDPANAPRVKAGFVAAGLTTREGLPLCEMSHTCRCVQH